jgi:hypothetical protein
MAEAPLLAAARTSVGLNAAGKTATPADRLASTTSRTNAGPGDERRPRRDRLLRLPGLDDGPGAHDRSRRGGGLDGREHVRDGERELDGAHARIDQGPGQAGGVGHARRSDHGQDPVLLDNLERASRVHDRRA